MGSKGSSKPPVQPAGASLVDEYTPWGTSTYTPVETIRVKGAPDQKRYRLDVNLTPEQKRLFEQEQTLNEGLNQLAIDQTGRLSGHLSNPVSFAGAPAVNAGSIQSGLSTGGLPSVRGLSSGNLPSVRQISTGGLSDLPGIDDFGAERQRVEDALYQRSASRLDPQWEAQQRAMESRLAAQGITAGSAAYRSALDDFSRGRNDAYAGARNDAILAGGGEQSRLFGDALAGRQQMFGERATTNAADLAYRNALFGERQAATAADLARRNQIFGERESAGSFANMAQQQDYAQQDQNRARYIEELLAQRNQPINEIAALLGTGGQGSPLQFRGSGEAGNAAAQQYQAQLAGWQNQQQAAQANRSGLYSTGAALGSAAIIAASDRRLKNLIGVVGQVGPHNVWLYTWKHDGSLDIGVMAQEVLEIAPHLVGEIGGGYLGVDYAGLLREYGR